MRFKKLIFTVFTIMLLLTLPAENALALSAYDVLKLAVKAYDRLAELLWTREPYTEITNYYYLASTGTIEFNNPLDKKQVFSVHKPMPGWEGHELEVHGINIDVIPQDIIVNIYWSVNDTPEVVDGGSAKLTQAQYFWITVPKTLPDNNGNGWYLVTWSDDDWTKWDLVHKAYGNPLGGCPYVSAWNGYDYVLENNVLIESEFLSERSQADVNDYYMLKNLRAKNNIYSIQLREFENEISHIDQVKLLTIDHDKNVKIAVTHEGKILTYKNPKPPKTAIDNNGNNVKDLIQQIDNKYFLGKPNDFVILNFGKINSDHAKLIINSDMKSYSINIQILKNNEWTTVTSLHPRHNFSVDIVDITSMLQEDEELKIRLFWTGYHKLDFVGLDTSENEKVIIKESRLISAFDIKGNIITEKVLNDDGIYSTIKPNDTITLNFNIPDMKEDYERDFVVFINGFYTLYPSYWTTNSVGTKVVGNGKLFIPLLLTYDNIKSIKWDFGDGTSSTAFMPYHEYSRGPCKGTLEVYYENGERILVTFYG